MTNIYQTMTAEGTARRKNSLIPKKTSMEKGVRVFSQEVEKLTCNARNSTYNQVDTLKAIAAPMFPSSNLNMKPQLIGKCKHKTANDDRSIGKIKLCVCKYLTNGLEIAPPNKAGIAHNAYFRASIEISWSCPINISNLSMKNHNTHIGKHTRNREIIAV